MQATYKEFNITWTYDLEKERTSIQCVKYEKRLDPRLLVNRKYNDVTLSDTIYLHNDLSEIFKHVKILINDWYGSPK